KYHFELKESLKAELSKEITSSLKQDYLKLSNECASLRKTVNEMSSMNNSDFVGRFNKLEHSFNEFSERSNNTSRDLYIRNESKVMHQYDNSSDFSILTDGEKAEAHVLNPYQPIKTNFVPFYIKEEYAARDNYTK